MRSGDRWNYRHSRRFQRNRLRGATDCDSAARARRHVSSSADSKVPLTNYNFQRTITITAFPNVANLRTITVLITYKAGRFQRSYTLTTNISNFS